MPLIVFYTRRVRDALKAPGRLGLDLLLLVAILALAGAIVSFAGEVAAPYRQRVQISLSFAALPKYTFFSLARGFAAYGLSLLFTLVYGTIAAHNRRAERVMLPTLDILQAIPVLGFLPSLVLAMVALFPTREVGLELACVLMIFTGQVWNMTFSFHGSLRSIPQPLREVAQVQRLGKWQVFRLLELPAATIGLVWNSMMSMAGGWFFLTVNEAFTLRNHDFRLPGIGSYMNEAINQGDVTAVVAAIVAMVVMIVTVDQLFWRPIVVWSQRFKVEETADADQPQSWVLHLLQRSFLFRRVGRYVRQSRPPLSVAVGRPVLWARLPEIWRRVGQRMLSYAQRAVRWLVLSALAVLVMWGAWSLGRLLLSLPLRTAGGQDWAHVVMALAASFLRTSAAVGIGAAWALPVGILIGLSPRWSNRLQPFIQIAASFPAPMLFPLVTMLIVLLHVPFGAGCVVLMLLGAQWYILFNVIAGASAIPADLKEVAEVYHLGRWQRWSRLYVPSVFPFLVTGLVTAAGGAWNATIVSEYVQLKGRTFAAFGLGSLISQATAEGNFPLLGAAVVTMAVTVVLINRLFWKRLYRLAEQRYSLNA